MEERLKETLEPKGYTVERIYFRLSYGQGDYATIEGNINVATWMESHKDGDQTYAEKYPALYLSVQDYGETATVSTRNRDCHASVDFGGNCAGNTYPAGVFSGLDNEAWDALVHDQFCAAELEEAMQSEVYSISRQLYRDLQEEYEHLTSEDSFIESCECNEVLFEIEECEA